MYTTEPSSQISIVVNEELVNANQWGLEIYLLVWSEMSSPVSPLEVLTSVLRTNVGPNMAGSHVDTCIAGNLI